MMPPLINAKPASGRIKFIALVGDAAREASLPRELTPDPDGLFAEPAVSPITGALPPTSAETMPTVGVG